MYKVDLNCDLGESFGHYKLGLDNEVIKLIIDVFDDLDKYVDIVEVEKIIDLKDNNNIDSQLNCLLGEKYILQEEK